MLGRPARHRQNDRLAGHSGFGTALSLRADSAQALALATAAPDLTLMLVLDKGEHLSDALRSLRDGLLDDTPRELSRRLAAFGGAADLPLLQAALTPGRPKDSTG